MTVVYRFYDAHHTLLYVGMSDKAGQRWNRHADEKWWFEQVVRVDVQHYPTREQASEAEVQAIQTEAPVYNIADSPILDRWSVSSVVVTLPSACAATPTSFEAFERVAEAHPGHASLIVQFGRRQWVSDLRISSSTAAVIALADTDVPPGTEVVSERFRAVKPYAVANSPF